MMRTKSIRTIIYSVIYTGLAIFAVWQCSKIIHTYIYNNRITVVEQRQIRPEIPIEFLTNLDVCLMYPKEKTILVDSWSLSDDERVRMFQNRQRTDFCDSEIPGEAIRNFTLQDKIDLISLLGKIYELDKTILMDGGPERGSDRMV